MTISCVEVPSSAAAIRPIEGRSGQIRRPIAQEIYQAVDRNAVYVPPGSSS